MGKTRLAIAALALAIVPSLGAQRRVRIGPTVSSIALEDLSGNSHSFTSVGGSVALITGDDGETGVSIARYHDLSTDNRVRRLTLFGLESYYYPVGTRGIAPFAATTLGLAQVTESAASCTLLLMCRDTVSSSSQFALAFGLGVRANLGRDAVATVEGRFLQVPGSQIQALEARATAAVALGPERKGEFLEGTLGPAASVLIPVSGALRARAPLLGVRFRRDTKKAGVLGLEIDFAALQVTSNCAPPNCQPNENAILFAPGYEASAWTASGRLYGELGLLVAGVYSQGPDRGMAEGAQGGIGADFYGGNLLWNVSARVLWLQRTSGENVFAVQAGVSLSPALHVRRR
jgi:hypothetical protein